MPKVYCSENNVIYSKIQIKCSHLKQYIRNELVSHYIYTISNTNLPWFFKIRLIYVSKCFHKCNRSDRVTRAHLCVQ